MQAVWVSGQGQTIAVDQGTGPALEVLSSPFTIAAPQLAVTRGTVLGDGNGSITQVVIEFNEGIDPSSLPIDPAAFSLQQPGLPPVAGTAVTVTPADDQGYSSSRIEVTFGGGLPKTDIQDVEIVYGSSTGLLGAHSGTALTTFSLNPSGDPGLIDGAPPVLLSSTALDTDGNGGLDVLRLVFSEPVRFSAGKGMSYGAPHDPTVDPGSLSYPAPSPLRILTSDLVVEEHEVPVVDEGDPDLPVITGATAMVGSLAEAARRASSRPAYTNFTATFVNGRYVLRSGAAGAGSSVSIPPAGAAGDLAPLLRLGTANGGIERTGQDSGIADLDDWVVLSADGRTNLLYGQTPANVSVTGDSVMVELTNVPNSGTSTPTFFWRDEGDRAFLCDRAPIPNCGLGLNNLSLPPDFHPRELLREASSFPGPGLTLQRTAQTGVVRLDATPSIAPTLAIDDAAVASFTWTQVGGPPVFGGVPPNGGVVDVVPLQSGVYEFELTLSIPDATGAAFNPWLEPDRTLRRTLLLTVTPGPQADVIVLLPGQTLVPGVTSASQAVSGTPRLATVGIPEVDDEVLVAFEQGDVAQPYVVGSLWNATASGEPDPTGRVKVVFHWDGDPRAVQWNIYRGSISVLADLDGDGLPDLGYGSCVSSNDPDPADEEFEDAEEPLPGDGFFYVGTMVMNAFGVLQETSPGITSEGLDRQTSGVCP